jgi:hypothetical protein
MKKLLFGTILLALSLGAAAKSITVFKNVTTAVTGVTAITPTASQRAIVRSALISSSANAFVSIYYGTTPKRLTPTTSPAMLASASTWPPTESLPCLLWRHRGPPASP